MKEFESDFRREKSHDVHYTYTSLLSKNPDANYQHPSRLIIKEQVLFHNH